MLTRLRRVQQKRVEGAVFAGYRYNEESTPPATGRCPKRNPKECFNGSDREKIVYVAAVFHDMSLTGSMPDNECLISQFYPARSRSLLDINRYILELDLGCISRRLKVFNLVEVQVAVDLVTHRVEFVDIFKVFVHLG